MGLLSGKPKIISLVGGPYCGLKINEKTGVCTTVYHDIERPDLPPDSFDSKVYRCTITEMVISVDGPQGRAIYDHRFSGRWQYRRESLSPKP